MMTSTQHRILLSMRSLSVVFVVVVVAAAGPAAAAAASSSSASPTDIASRRVGLRAPSSCWSGRGYSPSDRRRSSSSSSCVVAGTTSSSSLYGWGTRRSATATVTATTAPSYQRHGQHRLYEAQFRRRHLRSKLDRWKKLYGVDDGWRGGRRRLSPSSLLFPSHLLLPRPASAASTGRRRRTTTTTRGERDADRRDDVRLVGWRGKGQQRGGRDGEAHSAGSPSSSPSPPATAEGGGIANVDGADPFANPAAASYSDLSPLGRVVAGTVEIAVVTLLEYLSGFCGGYALGTLTDIPRVLFRPVQPDLRQPLLREIVGRTSRMHGKSLVWAKSWASISAAFGGFRVASKVVRGGVEDEWNTVISSMAAGAYFARNEGPQAMLRGALMYGALMYFLSGGFGGKTEPFQYEEKAVQF